MSKAITKPNLAAVVENTVRDLPPGATPASVAKLVVTHPAIAPALKPISRFKSEVIQGITAAGLAQFVQATGLGESLVIVNWLGFAPDPAQFSQVLTTAVTILGLVLAWYGRETTTRPLA